MPARGHPQLDAAFELLYAEQVGFVWRALGGFGVAPQSLEDATQDVFVVVHRRFGVWGDDDRLRPWLWGVARRVAASRRRTHERHRRKIAALPRPIPTRDAGPIEARTDARHQLERLAAAVDGLRPERREVWILAELEGLAPPEIAHLLGTKLNTVYSRLRRARDELSAALDPSQLDDAPQNSPHESDSRGRTTAHERSHARAR